MATNKLSFILAQGVNFLYPFSVGAAITLIEDDNPSLELIFSIVKKYKPTIFTSLPQYYQSILEYYREHSGDYFSATRYFICGGDILPFNLLREWKATFDKDICNVIGSTEVCTWCIATQPGRVKDGSLGQLCPGVEARVVGDDGNDVENGKIGTLWVRTSTLMNGYWRNQEATKRVMREDNWYITGDMVTKDLDGHFWYYGREQDLFKFGASFIAPREMAEQVTKSDFVRDSVVVVVGGVPIAFVILNEGVVKTEGTKGMILDGIKAETWSAVPMRPHDVVFIDQFPLTERKKVDIVKLKALYNSVHSSSGMSSM